MFCPAAPKPDPERPSNAAHSSSGLDCSSLSQPYLHQSTTRRRLQPALRSSGRINGALEARATCVNELIEGKILHHLCDRKTRGQSLRYGDSVGIYDNNC